MNIKDLEEFEKRFWADYESFIIQDRINTIKQVLGLLENKDIIHFCEATDSEGAVDLYELKSKLNKLIE